MTDENTSTVKEMKVLFEDRQRVAAVLKEYLPERGMTRDVAMQLARYVLKLPADFEFEKDWQSIMSMTRVRVVKNVELPDGTVDHVYYPRNIEQLPESPGTEVLTKLPASFLVPLPKEPLEEPEEVSEEVTTEKKKKKKDKSKKRGPAQVIVDGDFNRIEVVGRLKFKVESPDGSTVVKGTGHRVVLILEKHEEEEEEED